jgi:hypothetical protein
MPVEDHFLEVLSVLFLHYFECLQVTENETFQRGVFFQTIPKMVFFLAKNSLNESAVWEST